MLKGKLEHDLITSGLQESPLIYLSVVIGNKTRIPWVFFKYPIKSSLILLLSLQVLFEKYIKLNRHPNKSYNANKRKGIWCGDPRFSSLPFLRCINHK